MVKSQTVLFVFVCLYLSCLLYAGVTNPRISALSQVFVTQTDDTSQEDANAVTLNLGETELVFDDYLNPYARGFIVFSVDKEGLSTEEAYITVFRGLPEGLQLKGGKYRVGFGKLNPLHPHAYDFIEAPRVMAAMLPGEDGFNETGLQVSLWLPTFGSWASNVSVDIINGSSFHPEETKSALGLVGRWTNSFLISDITPLDLGISVAQGVNNTVWNTRTTVYGVDVKTKIPFTPAALTVLTLQGEYFCNDSDIVIDNITGESTHSIRQGFYTFADLKFWQRWNGGLIYDQYQPQENENLTNRAIKYFIGYSLLEETTLLRLAYEEFMPENSPVVHTWTFQVLYSMGPHKAHQF